MHRLARTACTRHINCHLQGVLCHQGSTSTAICHEEPVLLQRLRSPRLHERRQFSTSQIGHEEAAAAAAAGQGAVPSASRQNNRNAGVSARSTRQPFQARPQRFRKPLGPPPVRLYKDPLQAIERLSTVRTPIQAYDGTSLQEAIDSLPVLRSDGKAISASNARERQIHNTAVSKLIHGINKRHWKLAFHQGWAVLHARNGSHSRLNMDTTEDLVRLWAAQDEETIMADWEAVLETLLIPTLLREIELQSEHDSVIATWMWSEFAKDTVQARQRCITFWTAFVKHAKHTALGEKRGDPFYLLQVPTNIFSSALLAYFQSSFTLNEFIESFYQTIAVPSGLNPSITMQRVRRLLERSGVPTTRLLSSDENSEELLYWLNQMLFIRIWARVGQQSVRLACSTWRERTHQAAVSSTWAGLQAALQRLKQRTDQDWLVIDWASPEERRTRQAAISSTEVDRIEDAPSPDVKDAQAMGRENIWKQRPTLPVQFTPEIAAEFIRTFMHVDLLDEAEAAWTFLQSLDLKPNIVMWTALLHGHLHRKDLAAAEAVFQEMQRTPEAQPDMTARSILATAYFQAGEIVAGREAVEGMLAAASKGGHENVITTRVYNNIISGLLWNNNSPELALEVFQQMQDEGTPVDIYTINILLRHYSRRTTFSLDGVTGILEVMSHHNLDPDTYTLSMLLDALLLAGRPDAVAKVQEIMESLEVQASTATYGGMIDHLVKNSIKTGDKTRLDTALEMLRHMQASGQASTRPTEITYSGLVQGFCRFAVVWNSEEHLHTAEALHAEMVELGIPPNRITYNSLMAAYLANDNVPKALYYFGKYRELKGRRMVAQASAGSGIDDTDASTTLRQNVSMRTWQTLVTGLVDRKKYDTAREILQEMQEIGLSIHSPAFRKVADRAMKGGRVR